MGKVASERKITIDDLRSIDLAGLQEEIDNDEAALAELVAAHRKLIDGKKQLYKTVDVLKNGKKKLTRKPRQQKLAGSSAGPTVADRAARYLESAGSATPAAIARGIGLENAPSIYPPLADTTRFRKNSDGTYSLAARSCPASSKPARSST